MYYVLLFIGVLSLLSVLAWRDPTRGQMFPKVLPGLRGGQKPRPVAAVGASAARFIAGERKEDMPCVTPVDCVQTGRCAGHCGWR